MWMRRKTKGKNGYKEGKRRSRQRKIADQVKALFDFSISIPLAGDGECQHDGELLLLKVTCSKSSSKCIQPL